MKLILHVGLPKTGTTSIQEFFLKNNTLLKKRYKILYPTKILIGGAQHPLSWSILKASKN